MSPFEMSVVGFFLIVAIKAAHEAYLFWKEEEEIYEYVKQLSAQKKPRPIKRRADVRPLPVRRPPEDLPRAA